MLIVGAKGFAKEILQIIAIDLSYSDDRIVCFDNVSQDLPNLLYNRFAILKSFVEAKAYFNLNKDKQFVLGVGNPKIRKLLYSQFVELGGSPTTVVSKNCEIGNFDVIIADGTSIMSGTVVTNSIAIGKGCLINLNCTIGHDTKIGDFTEISPNVNISGRCTIGTEVTIGTNATILPDVIIGDCSIIGAGAVVTENVPANCMVAGVPAVIKKKFD